MHTICKIIKDRLQLLILILLGSFSAGYAKFVVSPDFAFAFNGYYKPEMFFGKNTSLFNNENDADKVWYARHTIDCVIDCFFGEFTYGVDVVELLFALRNKANWGGPGPAVTSSDIKQLEAVYGSHSHNDPRLLWWMRELWLRIDLKPAFNLPFENNHRVVIGSFSFQLGRGISLGDAYASGPGVLGFFTDDIVDQYAYGVKFSGDVLANVLSYDWYTAILQNKAFSLGTNTEKVLGQEYGRLLTPGRGFGVINFVTAFRLQWRVLDDKEKGTFVLEPYFLFNHDPEQGVEFLADASSKLGTIGLAGEFVGKSFEAGFDCAMNVGQQMVKGWDRNQIQQINYQGQVVVANSHVNAVIGTKADGSDVVVKAPYVTATNPAQVIINQTYHDQTQNGKEIGEVPSIGFLVADMGQAIILKNAADRFRNPYRNKFDGWMVVVDGGYWIIPKKLIAAIELGIASGDDNPNLETLDEEYGGFIGLQEIYTGKRVKSAFVLGGAGKVKRPFSQPRANQPSRFRNANAGHFTNIVYIGTGVTWKNAESLKPFKINPNVLAYWQERPLGTVVDEMGRIRAANPYLGTEVNIFASVNLLKDLEGYAVASMFFPGGHYVDRADAAFLSERVKELIDRSDVTGFNADRVPGLGFDIAYTLNVGLKYSF